MSESIKLGIVINTIQIKRLMIINLKYIDITIKGNKQIILQNYCKYDLIYLIA